MEKFIRLDVLYINPDRMFPIIEGPGPHPQFNWAAKLAGIKAPDLSKLGERPSVVFAFTEEGVREFRPSFECLWAIMGMDHPLPKGYKEELVWSTIEGHLGPVVYRDWAQVAWLIE